MYKSQNNIDLFTSEVKPAVSIVRLLDGAIVPFDLGNTDYQAYLKWLSEGNTPEAADEVAQ